MFGGVEKRMCHFNPKPTYCLYCCYCLDEWRMLCSHQVPTKQHNHSTPKVIPPTKKVNGWKTVTETLYISNDLSKEESNTTYFRLYLCEIVCNQTFFGLVILPTLAFQISMNFFIPSTNAKGRLTVSQYILVRH